MALFASGSLAEALVYMKISSKYPSELRAWDAELIITLLLAASVLVFHLFGWLTFASVLTWMALAGLVVLPVKGCGWKGSIFSIALFGIVFFSLGIVPGFDDFNPLGHWVNAGRIANGDWPVSNSLIPDLPLSYHWGIDAIAAFMKLPFGHSMSLGLAFALTQSTAWILQARIVFLLLGPMSGGIWDWSFRIVATAAVVLGTQWVFAPVFPEDNATYLWTNTTTIGGYRLIDSILAFGVHQRGFGLAFCFLMALSILSPKFLRRMNDRSNIAYALVIGALLAAMNIVHAVVFGVTALTIALLCIVYGIRSLFQDCSWQQVRFLAVSAALMAMPLGAVLTSAGMFAGEGGGEISRIIILAPFGFPRSGEGGLAAAGFWLIWFGPLVVSAFVLAVTWRSIPLPRISIELQIAALAALISFFMLFRFDHPNRWDGSKFLIVGTFCLTLTLALLLEGVLQKSRSTLLKVAIVLPLALNILSIGRQIWMLHQTYPGDLRAALFKPELQPDGPRFNAADALMIPDDTSHSRSVTWLAASFGMRQAFRYDYLYQYPVPEAKNHQYLAAVDAAVRLDKEAVRAMGIKVITFTDIQGTRDKQSRIEQMGFSRCGAVPAAGSNWPLWCRR
jgi:hypothetical protein